ncbi:hypothetical protein Pelo_18517 [Pelomyxa schiedti]|nr:hypothetical protein Pelo_18517 [Pelomyxa schiedti]
MHSDSCQKPYAVEGLVWCSSGKIPGSQRYILDRVSTHHTPKRTPVTVVQAALCAFVQSRSAVKKWCVPSASKRKRPPQPCPPAATPKPEYTAIHKGWDPDKFKIVGNNWHFWVLKEEGKMFILENRDLLLEGASKQLEAAGFDSKPQLHFYIPTFAGFCGHRDLAYCTIGFINLHHASFLDCAQKPAPCMFLGPCLKNAQCMFSKRIICKTEKLFPELALHIICETAMYGPALYQYLEAFPDPGTIHNLHTRTLHCVKTGKMGHYSQSWF